MCEICGHHEIGVGGVFDNERKTQASLKVCRCICRMVLVEICPKRIIVLSFMGRR